MCPASFRWTLGAVLYEMLYGLPPFYSKIRNVLYENIVKKPLKLKKFTSPSARSILVGVSLSCYDHNLFKVFILPLPRFTDL